MFSLNHIANMRFISQIISDCSKDTDKLQKYGAAGPLTKLGIVFPPIELSTVVAQAYENCKRASQEMLLCTRALQDKTAIDDARTLIANNPDRKDAKTLYDILERQPQEQAKRTIMTILKELSEYYDTNFEILKKDQQKPVIPTKKDVEDILYSAQQFMERGLTDQMALYHFYSKNIGKDHMNFIVQTKISSTPEQRQMLQTAINLIGEYVFCARMFELKDNDAANSSVLNQEIENSLKKIKELAQKDKELGYEHDKITQELEKFSLQFSLREQLDDYRRITLRKYLTPIARNIVETYRRVIADFKAS